MKKIALLLPLLLTSPLVFAEGSGIAGTDEAVANVTSDDNGWKVRLGGGVGSVPRYEGSANNRLRFVPMLDVENGHFFAGTSRGVGYNFSDDKSLQYGLRLTMSPYRKQSIDPHLNGMGDVNRSAEAGAFVSARFSPWYVNSSLAGSSHGARLEVGGGYELQLSPSDQLRAGVELNWANGKYMQTYFGVSPTQAAASAGVLTAYNATSGIKDTALKLNWMHSYSKEWFSNAGVTVKQLGTNAKNSPLTMKNTANSASVVLGYKF